MFCRFTLFLTVVLTLCARAEEVQQPLIRGINTVWEKDEVTVTGQARVSDGRLLLLADEIRYNFRTGTAWATGHVEFTRGPERLLADSLVYHRLDDSFTAENIRTGSYPIYAQGSSASGKKDEMTVNNAVVTFREPGPFVPTISADKITYAPGKAIRAEKGQIGVGLVTPIGLRKFEQRLNEPLAPYLTLAAGYRASLGANIDAGLWVPLAPGVNVGGDIGFYTARGLMVGPAGRYAAPSDPDSLNGYFRSGFIHDYGEKLTDQLGRPVPANRGYVEWQHRQELTDNLTLSAQLNYWKDSEILRDFRPRAFYAVQEPDTFLESVYTSKNYFVSLFTRFQPNDFQQVQQRLPEVRFDLLPLALGNGFYQQFNASATVLREDPVLTGAKLRSDRLDAYYALTRPFNPREWLTFKPIVGGRITHYTNTAGAAANGGYTRTLGEVGFDADLRSSATLNYKNEQWQIDGLRHLLTPRLSYRYAPEADRGRRYIPPIDRETFSTYLPPLGIGPTRNIDDLHALNTLRVGVDNTLQTRDPVYGSRDLFLFNAAADFRFERPPGEHELSEIHTELAAMPARWLRLDVFQSFSPQSFTLRQLQTGLTIQDGDQWSIRVANHYLRRDIAEYFVGGTVRINEAYEAMTRLHYDARRKRFVEQSYGIRHNLDNTWRIEYAITVYEGRSRESNFGFNIQIEAIRF